MTKMSKLLVAIAGILLAGPILVSAQSDNSSDRAIVETVAGFYNWYLNYTAPDEAGHLNNPLVDKAYRETPYLSAELVEKMDALLSAASIMYDPFVCAQDIPGSFEADVVAATPEQATVLLRTYFQFSPYSHNITLTLQPEASAWKLNAIACADTITPEGVTRDFYNWYLTAALGGPDKPAVNPLAERLYRDYPFLADELKARVDVMGEGDAGFRFDPFLCAQDVPDYVRVFTAERTPEAASVVVETFFSGNPTPGTALVGLKPVDGQWMIDMIGCTAGPETVAALLYNQYALHAALGMRHNLDLARFTDWTGFAWDRYMTADLLAAQSELDGAADKIADPFLCAQDLPTYFTAKTLEQGEDRAVVSITGYWPSGPGTFQGYPLAIVEAIRAGEDWKLSGHTCADR